jgi:hypothetical protein
LKEVDVSGVWVVHQFVGHHSVFLFTELNRLLQYQLKNTMNAASPVTMSPMNAKPSKRNMRKASSIVVSLAFVWSLGFDGGNPTLFLKHAFCHVL